MTGRIVIEYHTISEYEALMDELEANGYVSGRKVKVCGNGMCGECTMFSK